MRTLFIIATLFSALFSSCFKSCPDGQNQEPRNPPEILTGTVVNDSTNLPITNCLVQYSSEQKNECNHWEIHDSDETDSLGVFKINNHYSEGSITISVSCLGYQDYVSNIGYGGVPSQIRLAGN